MSSHHMVVSLKFIDRIVWEKSSITGSFRNYAISSKQEVPYKPPACITNLHLCRITGLSTWGQICTYLYCTNHFLWINDYLDGTWPNLRFTSVVDRLVWWTKTCKPVETINHLYVYKTLYNLLLKVSAWRSWKYQLFFNFSHIFCSKSLRFWLLLEEISIKASWYFHIMKCSLEAGA